MEIIPIYFLLSFLISLLILYFNNPNPQIIVRKINPKIDDNISHLYVDENNVCYRYHRHEIPCMYN
jgi:hypothetical protein